ncbi:unnamed protein product, partial [Meganyctiphanes norvegica]
MLSLLTLKFAMPSTAAVAVVAGEVTIPITEATSLVVPPPASAAGSSSISSISSSVSIESTNSSTDASATAAPTPTYREPKLVIHKCCPQDQVFSVADQDCRPSNAVSFSVPIFADDEYGMFIESNLTNDQVEIHTGFLTCSDMFELDTNPDAPPSFEFRVLDTGQLWVPEYNTQYQTEDYCLENFVKDPLIENSKHILGGAVCVAKTTVGDTFDPSKIPVRKCCLHDQVFHNDGFGCLQRENVTDLPWLTPMRTASGDVIHTDIKHYPFADTHEIVSDFQTCSSRERGIIMNEPFHVEENTGNLFLGLLNKAVSVDHYCIEDWLADSGELTAQAYVCLEDDVAEYVENLQVPGCQSEPCAQKCCKINQILEANSQTCIDANYTFTTTVWEDGISNITSEVLFDFKVGYPSCVEFMLTSEEEDSKLLASGALRYVSIDHDECEPELTYIVPRADFCVDQVLYPSGTLKQGSVLCFKENWEHLGLQKGEKLEVNYIYSVFLAISDLFILFSFIVYLTVPDKSHRGLNRNVKLAHSILGRILLCFLFSLFFAYLFLIIARTASDPIYVASTSACVAIGVGTYVFFMSTFFWLNVLCFELWWKCARQENSSGRRWIWYQIYAWICPLIFGGAALLMEYTPSISSCYIKPKFGTNACFFSFTRTHNNGAKWAYFFGPVAILLTADLIFFILTVRSLLVTVQQSHKGTVQKQARQRLRLCFKLFLVMGISWLAEIASFELGPQTVWYISDVFNCFQGFIIFLIFILKPKILKAVRARLCGCCEPPPPVKPNGNLDFASFAFSEQQSISTDEFSISNSSLTLSHSLASRTQSSSPKLSIIHNSLPTTQALQSLHAQQVLHSKLQNKTSISSSPFHKSYPHALTLSYPLSNSEITSDLQKQTDAKILNHADSHHFNKTQEDKKTSLGSSTSSSSYSTSSPSASTRSTSTRASSTPSTPRTASSRASVTTISQSVAEATL